MTSLLAIHDLVLARLQLAPNFYVGDAAMYVYDGADGGVPATPPMEEDGLISPYACLWTMPGLQITTSFDGDQDSLLGDFQITCVAGDDRRLLPVIDAVRAAVPGPVTLGDATRRIRANDGVSQQPIRTDAAVWPPRRYVALDFRIFAP
jgi:hypothetical protein